MTRPNLPLNALRAFEASARHRSFTKAAQELFVTQAAISHQVKGLEDRLGVKLFHRGPRGLMLSDEGVALLPALSESFDRIGRLLERFQDGRLREVLTVSAVGTFAVGWLLPRLKIFREAHPYVDLRLLTNNNRADLAAEGLDAAILYGDGIWPGAESAHLLDAPLSPLCIPEIAAQFTHPADLARQTLLRSYRVQDWPAWCEAAGLPEPIAAHGPVFDASLTMVQAALGGEGVALAPPDMFTRDLDEGRLVQPFPITVRIGAYYLASVRGKPDTPALASFRAWLAS
jgi:LysR family transcriptional regulator of beta-lactamase